MKLLIMRHGPAGDKRRWALSGKPDEARPLTPKGREKTRRAAKGLRRLAPDLDLVMTSPLLRARQTAEIVSTALKGPKPLDVDELKPDADPRALLRSLRGRRERGVALVGHEPQLGRFIAWACARRREPVSRLKKGQAMLLELLEDGAKARVLWSLEPSQLRLLARCA